jgi:hypothetical protein
VRKKTMAGYESKGTARVTSVERRERDGKEYFLVNGTAWYSVERYTETTAKEDYVRSHSNGGWGYVPGMTAFGK